jgi:hypothetical protein
MAAPRKRLSNQLKFTRSALYRHRDTSRVMNHRHMRVEPPKPILLLNILPANPLRERSSRQNPRVCNQIRAIYEI